MHRHHVQAFVREIWKWHAMHKRDLPWRDRAIKDSNEHAYQVLVSEVMLQQTQVARVKIVFRDFLERFPRMQDLAAASNRDVLIAWRGMGYNSRALRLRDAALEIVDRFLPPSPRPTAAGRARLRWAGGSSVARLKRIQKATSSQAPKLPVSSCPSCAGKFPRCIPCLLSIKGIGPYTAAAIRNFAFGIETPCLDTNIRRVLHRTFVGPENPDGTWKASDKELLKLAEEVLEAALEPVKGFRGIRGNSSSDSSVSSVSSVSSLPLRTTAEWHHALMDFGSLVQTKKNPKWDQCPLTKKNLMKAQPQHYDLNELPNHPATGKRTTVSRKKREPGRTVGGTFIPNRIFRGKIVEELRDARRGLPLSELGKRICLDWKPAEHRVWLKDILAKLEKDALIDRRRGKYVLKQ